MTSESKQNIAHQNNTQESNKARFKIDLIPIEDKNDKFSYLTNLSLLQGIKDNVILKRLGCTDAYYTSQVKLFDVSFKVFYQNIKKIGYAFSASADYEPTKIGNLGILIFKVDSFDMIGSKIKIKTTDNKFYVGNIDDYLEKGVCTLHLKTEGEITSILHQDLQTQKHYLESGLVKIKSKQLLMAGADDYCITDEQNKKLTILKNNQVGEYQYDDDSIDLISDLYDLSNYGTIQNIKTDSNNNFYFIISENGGQSYLRVLNRKTLEEIYCFENITKIVYMSDKMGQLLCIDKDGYLRIVQINTSNLPRGYVDGNSITAESTKKNIIKIEDKPRAELQQLLSSGGITIGGIDIESTEIGQTNISDTALRNELWTLPHESLDNKSLKDLYDEAQTPDQIDIAYGVLQQMKGLPQVNAIPGLIQPLETKIIDRRNHIKLSAIFEKLDIISQSLVESDDFSGLVHLKTELENLKVERSQIMLPSTKQDTELKNLIKQVEQKITDYREEHKAQILQDIENNLGSIKEYLADVDYLPQINNVITTDVWKQTETMIGYLDNETKKEYKRKLHHLRESRQSELTHQERTKEKSSQQEQEEMLQDIQSSIGQIKGVIESIYDPDGLMAFSMFDPLVLQVRNSLKLISGNKSQELALLLDNTFKSRALSIQYNKEQTVGSIKSLDQYGIPKSLYFVPDLTKKIKRDILGTPTEKGTMKLMFQSTAGNTIKPSVNKKIFGHMSFEYTFEEWKELKESIRKWKSNGVKKELSDALQKFKDLEKSNPGTYEQHAEYQQAKKEYDELEKKYYVAKMLDTMNAMSNNGIRHMNPRPMLPHISNKTVIGNTIKDTLGKRGRLMSQQLQYKQGIIIVESEAATGKNFKMELLAHLTNRELIVIPCNKNMEIADLLFSKELGPDGTYYKQSDLVKGATTPGTIIVLDEVNSLQHGVPKVFNSTLSPGPGGKRYIIHPQIGRIEVHPTVIFVGLMNPRYYLGTNDLAQEFVSRARFTQDTYSSDIEEGFMMAKYLDGPIGDLGQDQFDILWNKFVVAKDKPSGDQKLFNIFTDIKRVISTAADMRLRYSETMAGTADFDNELKWIFTPREMIQIMQDFNYTQDMRKSLEDVILPKISDKNHKKVAEDIIAKPENFGPKK